MKGKKVDNLKDYRQKIDKINNQILSLLKDRVSVAQKIGKIKQKQNRPIYDPAREKKILKTVVSKAKNLPPAAVEAIFQEIISLCRASELKLKVAYLGPEGTFTHEAATKQFGKSVTFVPCKTISDIFEAVAASRCEFGVVPIENSTEGPVRQTHKLLIEKEVAVCGEIMLPIHHNLLVKASLKIDGISRIYSHPQALGQCRTWLQKNLPKATIKEASSTAEAAKMLRQGKKAGAIANKLAAELYGLKILAPQIEDNSNNTTRFFVLAKNGELLKKKAIKKLKYKTSLLFTVKDRPGVLRDCLSCFADREINLTRIISHPSKKRLWDFVFFIDLDGHFQEKKVVEALAGLEKNCQSLKILGSYSKA